MLAKRHDGELGPGFMIAQAGFRLVEKRQSFGGGFPAERLHGPQGCTPAEADGAEGARLGEPLDLAEIEAGAQPDVAHRLVAVAGTLDEFLHPLLRQPLDLPEAEPDGVPGPDDAAHPGMPLDDPA